MPTPAPAAGEVLVRVRASALNRADLLQRRGQYPAPPGAPADIPGLEIAGEVVEVVEVGADPAPGGAWRAGDRVFGIVAGGGNAEFVVIHASHLARIPDSLDWEQAAAVPEAFMTAHDALFAQAELRKAERALVHAAGSGVGLAVAQLVRAAGGACYGTARTKDKIDRARALGLTDGVVVGDDLAAIGSSVQRWTNGAGIDVTLDLVAGPYLPVDVDCAALRGRIVLIGLMAGRSATLDLGKILTKRLTIRGTTLRSRSVGEKAAVTAAFSDDVLPLLASGSVKPVVDRAFPLDRIRDAHALLESNQTFGKIVLTH